MRRSSGRPACHSHACVLKVPLRPGDEILIEGVPDGGEAAALDYVEISPWSE